jgi:RNA polymerase sigma-70 factor (ECF subfamily)
MAADPVHAPACEPTDGDLIAAHHAGAQAAFDTLCRRYQTRLVRFLTTRTGDAGLAEDLAQGTLLRAYQNLDGFDVTRPAWPWLKAIATNVSIDYARSPQSRPVPTEDDMLARAFDHAPEEDMGDALALRELLSLSMEVLSPRQRAAIRMRYLDDLTTGDVARIFGIEANAAAQLVMRARRRMCAECVPAHPGTRQRGHAHRQHPTHADPHPRLLRAAPLAPARRPRATPPLPRHARRHGPDHGTAVGREELA